MSADPNCRCTFTPKVNAFGFPVDGYDRDTRHCPFHAASKEK